MALFDIFKSAAKNTSPPDKGNAPAATPRADQDFVDEKGRGQEETIINFREIVRDGLVPNGAGNHEYRYDPHANDTFNQALKQIEDKTAQAIEQLERTDPDFKKLMTKEHWDKEDRNKYDEKVAQIISNEVDKYPGFKNYRTVNDKNNPDVKDVTNINDLSGDLATGKSTTRFDCGVMSLTEGIVRQRIEDNHNFLPKTGDVDDYKKDMAFHYAGGGVSGTTFGLNNSVGGHAFVLTPTMQVIEGTANAGQNPFKRVANGTTFDQFADGKPLILKDGTVYGGVYNDFGRHEAYRREAADAEAGRSEVGRNFSLAQLQNRDKIPGFTVTTASSSGNKTGKPDLVMIASHTKAGDGENFEMKVYKIHDVGTAQEGYSMAGYQAARKPLGTADAQLSAVIKDDQGHKFKFDADFNKSQSKLDVYQHNGDQINLRTDGYNRIAETAKQTGSVPPPAPAPVTTPAPAPAVVKPAPAPAVVKPPAPQPVTPVAAPRSPSPTPPAAPKVPSPPAPAAPGPSAKGDPADLMKIQQGLKDMGLYKGAADGKMNADTQAALQNLIVRAQMSDVYKHEHGNVEGIYGPKTQKAFEEMVAKGQMKPELMNAIKDMNAKGELRKVYTPKDVDATKAAIGKDPGLMAKIGEIKPAQAAAADITKLQTGLKAAGLVQDSPTGKLDDKTRQAVETLLVRAQMTGVYKATGDHIDGTYGKDTLKALEAMADKHQISRELVETIKDLDKKGALEDVYSRGNLAATITQIKGDPAAMKLINEVTAVAPQTLPAPGATNHAPATGR